MKNVKVLYGLIAVFLSAGALRAAGTSVSVGLAAGPFRVGFRLIETSDASRSFPLPGADRAAARPMRIYLWYPAQPTASAPMEFDDYVLLALGDFRPAALPVPLARGLAPAALRDLRAAPVWAVRDAPAGPGRYPVLVFGQGLFFESPVANFLLCEYLASHGYVIAACPLRGTLTRLVNINVEDVETEVRDMEFAAAEAGRLPFADPGRTGVIGFDLGGMAGMLLAMRDLRVGAFLSLDSGILDRHYTGLPATHPQYPEERFGVPWMHMTQARFIRPAADRSARPSLFERKAYGRLGAPNSMAVGDFNSDGFQDILVGAANADRPGSSSSADNGMAYILYGKKPFPAQIDLKSFTNASVVIIGADFGDRLGTAVAAGDGSGDGYSDILIASRMASTPFTTKNHVFLGGPNGPPTLPEHPLPSARIAAPLCMTRSPTSSAATLPVAESPCSTSCAPVSITRSSEVQS